MKFLFFLIPICVIACFSPRIEVVERTDRGLLSCTEKVEFRRVNNYWWEMEFAGKPFVPDGRESNKVGACRTSMAADGTVFVVLLGESIWRFQTLGGKPVLLPIPRPAGMDSIEQFKTGIYSCNGKCMVWPAQITFLETGETRIIPRIEGEILGLSPDLRTAVCRGDSSDGIVSIRIIDIESSAVQVKSFSHQFVPWLQDYTKGEEPIAAHFRWMRDSSGRDRLVYP